MSHRYAIPAILAASAMLTGCQPKVDEHAGSQAISQQQQADVAGPIWQFTSIYTSPDAQNDVPQSVAGGVNIVFGDSSAIGATGCAQLKAKTSYSKGGQAAKPNEADRMRFERVSIDNPRPDCSGEGKDVHDRLSGLLHDGAEYDLKRLGPTELLLTSTDAQNPNRPSMRLFAL